MSQGQIDEGASQFKAVLDLDASNGAARQGLATGYRILAARMLERGNSAQAAVQAAVQAREAVRLNPADAEAHNLLGVALASQGQFAEAAQEAGVEQIVYLGGLGRDADLSAHLASRHEVGRLLRGGGVPTVELRASIIIGSGSASFEGSLSSVSPIGSLFAVEM